MGRQGRRTKEMVNAARSRIEVLFSLADEMAKKGRFEYASRYGTLARRIGMRYNVRVPKRYRQKYCKKCQSYLVPGKNCKVRLNRGIITTTCLQCDHRYRHPYTREQRRRRGGAKGE